MTTSGHRLGLKSELEHAFRISDQMVTMHSALRDRYAQLALITDCALFAASVVVVALVWVDPSLVEWLPGGITESRVVIGSFSIATFLLSLLSFRVDWKAKSELHRHASEAYSQIKLECRRLLGEIDYAPEADIQRCLARYSDLGQICIAIPENQFLRLKKMHKLKILISKHLDENPETCLWLLRVGMCARSTLKTVRHGFGRKPRERQGGTGT